MSTNTTVTPTINLGCNVDGNEIPSTAFEVFKDIQHSQSLSASTKRYGHSYSFGWTYAKKLQKAFDTELIERKGSVALGSTLSEAGAEVINSYNNWAEDVERYAQQKWEAEVAPCFAKLDNK